MDRDAQSTKKKIYKKKDIADNEEEKLFILKDRLRVLKKKHLSRRRKVHRFCKILKLAESRAVTQTKYLKKKIKAEVTALNFFSSLKPFESKLNELAAITSSQLN